MLAEVNFPNLLGSPMPMSLFDPHDRADLFLTQLARTTMRTPTLFLHRAETLGPKAISPLVAHAGADPILSA